MLNRDDEIRHLAKADYHIARTSELIQRMQKSVADSRGRGESNDQEVRTIEALSRALSEFMAHRDQIVQALRDIDASER